MCVIIRAANDRSRRHCTVNPRASRDGPGVGLSEIPTFRLPCW